MLFSQAYGESPMAGMGPSGNIMHCTIRAAGSTIMMCDDPNPDRLLEDPALPGGP